MIVPEIVRSKRIRVVLAAICVGVLTGAAPAAAQSSLTGSVRVHDPSRIVKENGRYYLFSTGNNGTGEILRTRYSNDLSQWFTGTAPLTTAPAWTNTAVPMHETSFWAPDVVQLGGQYLLYYSVSRFGSQTSAIGLATSASLDPTSPAYGWVDKGPVLQSGSGAPYNAIDPGIFLNDDGRMWLTFGSFWNGIYITELNPSTGLRLSPTSPVTRLAQNVPSTQIEAPFLHKEGDAYYLFVNWGTCCAGTNSSYNIRVGRSTSPTGPFLDKNGSNMVSGGGSLFLGAQTPLIGPGHFSLFAENGVDYFSYHYYDAADNGRSKLDLRTIRWTPDGWPVVADMLNPADFTADGLVNDADLATWMDQFAATGVADADGDGDSDGADFLAWQRQLGAGPGTSSVPEPEFAAIMGTLALGCARASRRRRKDGALPSRR